MTVVPGFKGAAWVLEVTAELAGLDYGVEFRLPIRLAGMAEQLRAV